MLLQPNLRGVSLTLRPLLAKDFEQLFLAASDPLIWEQHPDKLRYEREVFQKYFDSGLASKGCLVAIDQKTSEIIGSSRYYNYDADRRIVTVGFTFIKRAYWGGEFNKELKHLMLSHAFQFVDTVLFEVGSENFRSQKALLKIGATQVSSIQAPGPNGQPLTKLTFSLYKTDFESK